MTRPSDDLQRNLVSVVLTIVGLMQGLVLTKIAETMAPLITGRNTQYTPVDCLLLVLLFAVFLRIFQTFVVGAIGYEKSAIEAIELFALTVLLFLIGILEYVVINLYTSGRLTALYWVLTGMCLLAAITYGWLCVRAMAFSQHDPPYATRDRKLQGINTALAALEAAACAWLASGAPAPVSFVLIVAVTTMLLANIYVSIKFSFYPAETKSQTFPWKPSAELLLLYVLPPLLIRAGIIDFQWRMQVLVVVGLAVLIVALIEGGFEWPRLGQRQWIESLVANGAIVAVAGGIAVAYWSAHGAGGAAYPSAQFMVFYALVSAPMQEFVYRYRLRMMFKAFPAAVYVVASAAFYAWAHIVYTDPTIAIGAFGLGLIWGAVFVRTREIVGVTLSHIAVGAIAFWIGAA
jgi:membrane protease YdiL (CAAX protease family)